MKKQTCRLKIQRKGKSYQIIDSPLYKLMTKKKLCKVLLLTSEELAAYIEEQDNYSEFESIGKNGKRRKIQKPLGKLDAIHTRIASLLSRIESPDYLHSGTKARSNVTNAFAHKGCSKILSTDIRSFFPSTSRRMVFSFFYSYMKCSADVADILSRLTTCHSFIPTGSRISMPLAFLVNINLFDELYSLSNKHDVKMTVYVDDLTFSGESVNRLFRACVRKIIEKHGHKMHLGKTKIYTESQPKLVTGVVIYNDELRVRNEQHRLLATDIEQWKLIKNTSSACAQSLTDRLVGRLYAMGVINPIFKAKALTLKSNPRT